MTDEPQNGAEQPIGAELTGGFDLDENVVVVVLKAEQGGKIHLLKHHLREPSPKQWKEYQAAANKYKAGRRDIEIKDCTLAAREKLWNEIAIKVEGYRKGGKPLECSGEQWKRDMRVLHKSQAIVQLGQVWAPDEEREKNFETTSDD